MKLTVKKFLKILSIAAGVVIMVIAVLGIYVFHRLPSAAAIGSFFKPKAATGATVAETDSAVVAPSTPVPSAATGASQDVTGSEEVEAPDATIKEALVSDLISTQKPMSDFCSSLKNAKDGTFDQQEFGAAFNNSLDEKTRDPRIQAVKPMLRYVMRLPKMNDMIQEAQAAVERHDEGFLEKAEFYSKALSAFGEMKEHKGDIESVMDRSYLLLGLNKLVAKKPELLDDPRIQNYCGGVELSFNQARPVDYDNEKKDFLGLLNDLDVKPEDIGFDPEYKSDVSFNFSGQALTFEGGWLSDLVQSDVDMDTNLQRDEGGSEDQTQVQ